ncbi:hypothetical protein BDK51DRAFT_19400 [Blyttiomyces helicus]|uniref:Ubiquitin-activating enzyme E1-like n=1 Tax=Blyttiomyces helicus TaxID=388810 RepID=A0A4P9WDP9_9FUNG|nr:hypothetical protein BDK51DRAFT_19400 [Blyttiomyces helicus]|eukprot:RKO88486.1 hypothetical protein BDK51DRAFT_19400 [Blyttiomyces helicus]
MDSHRYLHISTALQKDRFGKLAKTRILVVGAGGIGCELLKNIVLTGFQDVHVVDLDTIDLSNLNRQFLFQRKHIKKSKAEVACETASKFNPSVNLVPYHASIYESRFSVSWFAGFDIVLNALDNVAARRHVNMMCLAANIPLVESGTEGYNGQVTLHVKGKTPCYDCEPKPTRKTYPVCTIRSTPSEPIHCIVWAKSYLFNQLFGKSEDEEDEAIDGETTADNAKEIAELKKEAEALKRLKDAAGSDGYGKMVFEKVFTDDINRLLGMEDLWKSRARPTPLKFIPNLPELAAHGLELDQKVWTLEENIRVFLDSLKTLTKRLHEARATDPDHSLVFDKDDEETLNFVTATANLRSRIYGIEEKSRFTVKEMAGNIIPAIATTNAIIAGTIVLTALKVIDGTWSGYFNTYLNKTLHTEKFPKPNPFCAVCSANYLNLKIDTEVATLRTLVEVVLGGDANGGLNIPGELAVEESGRLLYDVEFDDNLDSTLASLGIRDSCRVRITNESDEEEKAVAVVLSIEHW